MGSSGADGIWAAGLGRRHTAVLGFLLPPFPYVISKWIFLLLPPETILNFLLLLILAAATPDQAALTRIAHSLSVPSVSSHP